MISSSGVVDCVNSNEKLSGTVVLYLNAPQRAVGALVKNPATSFGSRI